MTESGLCSGRRGEEMLKSAAALSGARHAVAGFAIERPRALRSGRERRYDDHLQRRHGWNGTHGDFVGRRQNSLCWRERWLLCEHRIQRSQTTLDVHRGVHNGDQRGQGEFRHRKTGTKQDKFIDGTGTVPLRRSRFRPSRGRAGVSLGLGGWL